jgi:hypothetical protein
MFLVGHMATAFLIVYLLSKGMPAKKFSISIAMFLSVLPDVDIILQSIDVLPHKTLTHSAIVGGVACALLVIGSRSFVVAVYCISYMQHVLLGDIIIGTINLLYPFGNLPVGFGINFGTLFHIAIEVLLLVTMAAIVLNESFAGRVGGFNTFFSYRKIDIIAYLLLILSLVLSFAYLLYRMEDLPRLFIETKSEIVLFVILHMAAILLVLFKILVSHKRSVIVRA